jgi:uncharacterized protein YjbJ (UPF0337 family)
MNWDVIKGNWNEWKGRAKQEWADLTDDELLAMEGGRDRVVGVLQQKYGWAKEEAEDRADAWANRMDSPSGAYADEPGIWDDIQRGWEELKVKMRSTWADLTDEDVAPVQSGRREEVVSMLQNKYGWTRAEAEARADEWAMNSRLL